MFVQYGFIVLCLVVVGVLVDKLRIFLDRHELDRHEEYHRNRPPFDSTERIKIVSSVGSGTAHRHKTNVVHESKIVDAKSSDNLQSFILGSVVKIRNNSSAFVKNEQHASSIADDRIAKDQKRMSRCGRRSKRYMPQKQLAIMIRSNKM